MMLMRHVLEDVTLNILFLVFMCSGVPQETSHVKLQNHSDFFFPKTESSWSTVIQNETEIFVTVTPTPFPSTSTKKEFTAIAFPPQVFEILIGNEPTSQNLGGRKNATSEWLVSHNNTTTSVDSQNLAPALNSNQVPGIFNGITRPPTRFTLGNKPSSLRPTQTPIYTTTPHYVQQTNFPNYNSNPQVSAIAALLQQRHNVTINTTNNFGEPLTTSTKRVQSTSPRPRPPVTNCNSGYSGQPLTIAKYKDVVHTIRGVTEYLQEFLTSKSGLWDGYKNNFLISPLSVSLTMAQTLIAEGAQARSSLRNILRLSVKTDRNEEMRSDFMFHKAFGELISCMQRSAPSAPDNAAWNRCTVDPYNLAVNTAVFVRTGLTIRPTFSDAIENIYKGRLQPVDFKRKPYKTMETINNWAQEATRGKITNFLSYPPSLNTTVMFASSLYFKAKWRVPFSERLTVNGDFRVTPHEKISTLFMKGEVNNGSKFIDSTKFDVKGVRLAYNNTEEVALYMFLPKNEFTNIQEFAKRLLRPYTKVTNQRLNSTSFPVSTDFQDPLPTSWQTHERVSSNITGQSDAPADVNDRWEMDEIIASMKQKSVVLSIPKLILRGSLKLYLPGRPNNEYLPEMLENPAELAGDAVGSIMHETILELTETGTEAAAITAGFVEYTGGSATFVADRPFMLLLRHELSGIPLFWGAVCRPTDTQKPQ